MSISVAQKAKADKYLNTLVGTSKYGVVTWREYVEKTLNSGGHVEVVQVRDENATEKLRERFEFMNRGFNVPWGNECHPKTIEAQRLKAQIATGVMAAEYRLYQSGETDSWSVITKTAFDYAQRLVH